MNIVTYCSAVAIGPPRVYCVSLYVGTLSWENFRSNGGRGVLQVLNRNQAGLVDLLGRTSGRGVDKIRELREEHGLEVEEWHGIPTLRDCAGGLLLRATSPDLVNCGDHEVALCEVVDERRGGGATSPLLTTGYLREHGLL
ncbi:flavin reductase-like domain-containing protein [Chloropicon primus]|nr:hypothetical protein A3770_07p48290 [Chloropicon primus]UPR01527.1 flavin reductase-like domain-containing protein [Chloropicon primus]|eukprot:QDZ22311.1 hypothetical protein A3770_07p48290 [Chloropicon primus]